MGVCRGKWPVEAYREDIILMGNDARNYPNWVDLYNFTNTNGNSQVSSYWWNNYKGISFSNQVIEKVSLIPDDKINTGVREQIVNEAHFLRAYYHLKLILNWKEIIIRDKYITNQEDLNKGLSSRSDAWDFIISDLKKKPLPFRPLTMPIIWDGQPGGCCLCLPGICLPYTCI